MPRPLDPSWRLLRQAKVRIDDLQTEVAALLKSHTPSPVTEPDPDGIHELHKFVLLHDLQETTPMLAAEAVGHLRTALDHAGVVAAQAVGSAGKNAAFPFGDDAKEVASRRNASSQDIPPAIFDAMVALEPHAGGNRTLWALNKLSNQNKHTLITPVGVLTDPIRVQPGGLPDGVQLIPDPVWDDAKQEMVYARTLIGQKPDYHFHITVHVLLADVKGIGRQKSVPFLRSAYGQVERSLVLIERAGVVAKIFKPFP